MERDEFAEHQYSCSRWSKRYSTKEEVLAQHFELVTKVSEEVASKYPNEEVRYGNGDKQIMTIFGGNTIPQDAPIYAHIHGGYWQALDRTMTYYPVTPLLEAGIRPIIVGYDLNPAVNIKEIIDEIKQAVDFILDLALKWNSPGLYLGGHSAGAHLSTALFHFGWMSGLEEERRSLLKGMVLISGIYELYPLVGTHINDILKLNREGFDEVSTYPLKNPPSNMKFIVTVGGIESGEFYKQSKIIYDALKKTNDAELLVLEECDHFDIVELLREKDFILTQKIMNMILNNNNNNVA